MPQVDKEKKAGKWGWGIEVTGFYFILADADFSFFFLFRQTLIFFLLLFFGDYIFGPLVSKARRRRRERGGIHMPFCIHMM